MPKTTINGIQLHYQQKGEGPDVVLIHGITSSLAMWYNGTLPTLSQKYRTTIYDMRGHGLSDITPNGYDSASMARDLIGLMDHCGIQNAIVVGHSYGGAVGLNTALDFPDRIRGVVMLDTGLACLRHLRIIQEWVGWNNRPEDMMKNGLTLEQFMDLDSKQDVTDILRHGLSVPRRAGFRKGEPGLTPRMERLLATQMGYEFREVSSMTEDRLPHVHCPVLAMYGETSPYKKMANHLTQILQKCHNDVLPGAGHFYAVHRPEMVLERIEGFLEDPEAYIEGKKTQAAT